ncbi:MAG: FMN-binding glutamate synthase family protein [Cyanobacteria bacterium]|nr:FMN-binding glutamate synthase family protein [Cyanobacteriota bacterium]
MQFNSVQTLTNTPNLKSLLKPQKQSLKDLSIIVNPEESSPLPPSLLRFEGKKKSGHISFRKLFYALSLGSIATVEGAAQLEPQSRLAYLATAPLIALGLYDANQKKHAILRNFPILGRARYLAELIRPEMRQYFGESETDGKPFNELQRRIVYERAKNDLNTLPFGTRQDVYREGAERINHSIAALPAMEGDIRVTIGGPECKKPYSSSILNISAMSYGALSKAAILALNKGAKKGNFAHNTGEGGVSPYHLEPGGDVIWQIGTGYFSCRTPDGKFSPEAFAEKAKLENIKMIELKLSQGAKPGHGGILPKEKLTQEIIDIRLVAPGKDVLSPPAHTAFSTPREMMLFIKQLRELSGGKPIGFKLCVGNKHEFLGICKAMVETGIYPDYIAVDGAEGGTGAAPREFSDYIGMPLNDALVFVHNALVGINARDKVKVMAAGKIIDGFDIVSKIAMGADVLYSARGMMFALGCIQALQCHSNNCPTGVATQNPDLVKGLDPTDKGERVYNFHKNTIHSVKELIGAAGLKSQRDLRPWHIQKRVSPTEVKNLYELYEYIPKGSLLKPETVPPSFKRDWAMADPNSFAPKVKIKNPEVPPVAALEESVPTPTPPIEGKPLLLPPESKRIPLDVVE